MSLDKMVSKYKSGENCMLDHHSKEVYKLKHKDVKNTMSSKRRDSPELFYILKRLKNMFIMD